MSKLFPAILVSAVLAASSLALAQTTPPQPGQPGKSPPPSAVPAEKISPPGANPAPGSAAVEPQWHTPQAGELRASKLIGTSVKSTAGETIGDINEVVIGKDGKVVAVVVGVGGFLGLGEREVALRYDSLQLSRGNNQSITATTQTTKASLKNAPEWSWSADEKSGAKGTGSAPTR
jgi:sporulation protein YlmC with PRC-barrel domain